jgi:hypothetical protein
MIERGGLSFRAFNRQKSAPSDSALLISREQIAVLTEK